ncbi:MAG: ATP-dependent DNA helicase RecG [Phycisphaerales bacterium]
MPHVGAARLYPAPIAAAAAISLASPLADVPGLTPRTAADLATLGLTNVGRLLAHLPMRHERHEAEAPIGSLQVGHIVSARGQITATRLAGRRGKGRFEAVLMDDSGRLDLVWFNQPFMHKKVHPGMRVIVQGTLRTYGQGFQLANPRLEVLKEDAAEPESRDERLRPVYPASEQVPSRTIEWAMARVLPVGLPLLEDHLPEAYRRERAMPSLADAYRMQHAPESEDEVAAGRRRLAYDELLMLQLGVQMRRAYLRSHLRAPALKMSDRIDAHIRERFPFPLTPGQESVVADLVRDLTQPVPTNRLIQGDVGAGKTIVALYAMLMAVASEHQGALMAPTELLAEQHFASISRVLAGSRVRIELLTGAIKGDERASILARLGDGEIDILVGTHALLTEKVRFKSLAVAIVDEQHRFGVHQRAALRVKAEDERSTPHLLVMTATPIPRTLTISLLGDLDVSVIDGLPPGRQPIATRVVPPDKRAEVFDFLRTRVERGEQAYVVVPSIESDELESVESVRRELEEGPLAGRRISAVHGRLAQATRAAAMERFRGGSTDVLVATTVIEVGVDVPNATVMVILNADRFGLAQLHQLRGRVGRGDKPSVCVLVAEATTEDATLRLDAVRDTADGFKLAEKDWEIRGPGELFGTRQSGAATFRVADLSRDIDLLQMARRDATAWIERSPTLHAPDEALLRRRLFKAFGQTLGLVDVG